jgi:hypothetical protein
VILFFYYDTNPKIIISKSGIWTTKSKDVVWSEIWYFYFEQVDTIAGPNVTHFHFKIKVTEEEFRIPLGDLDKSFQEIHEAIITYSPIDSVLDLGFSTKPKF